MKNKKWATWWWNWGKKNLNEAGSPCGKGSTVEGTRVVKDYIEKIVCEYNIKSVSDAPCGQYNLWTKDVDFNGADYTGYDINAELVVLNNREFPHIKFVEFDVVNQVLPYADLIMCKDLLFHFPNNFAMRAIQNFKRSDSKYLLCTNHNNIDQHKVCLHYQMIK